jgi:hypothetical protein
MNFCTNEKKIKTFHAYAILASLASMPQRFFSISTLLYLTTYTASPQHYWWIGGSKNRQFLVKTMHESTMLPRVNGSGTVFSTQRKTKKCDPTLL